MASCWTKENEKGGRKSNYERNNDDGQTGRAIWCRGKRWKMEMIALTSRDGPAARSNSVVPSLSVVLMALSWAEREID